MAYDLLIRNGRIVDGSGMPSFMGDVAVKNGKIAEIGKLSGAADEVRAMLEEARRDAEGTKQQIVAEAKSAAHAEHERAMREIRTATDAAVEELSQRSADLAVALAGKIVSAKLTGEERSRLVRESLSRFAAAAPSRN